MIRGHSRLTAPRLAVATGLAAFLAAAAPAIVLGHQLSSVYESRLPLAVYLFGAAVTVALSFGFVLVRDVRADPPLMDQPASIPPRPIRLGLRALGLFAWLWIVAQGIAGGASDGNVATLFLWVYGWVGLAIVSAFVGPAWHWLDPFSTIHDIAAAAVRAAGIRPWATSPYPAGLGRWPAIVGFAGFIWLELVMAGGGPALLFVVLVGYTAFTVAMMAQFGRDTWRANGETFTVWFRTLGRLAHWALVDETGRVRARPFASGLLEPGWTVPDIVVIALGVGSILFDGLSQTKAYFDLFGFPAIPEQTVILLGWLAIVVALALFVTRFVGLAATGAGLLPIAVGYLIAHYLTYLLIDGQRIVIAISDPLQRGDDLFGTAFVEPTGTFLPPGLVWTVQLAAVVGGHMLGAWAGHVVAAQHAPSRADTTALRRREIPLAVVMVGLTTLTLWSLGQAIVSPPQSTGTGPDLPALARDESAPAPPL